ncbi:4-alpha-glucanotransferase [Verrucomicrobium sp. GAS474]|uniref:4-alpha-glucanotransferase n=1 Tax=Verrucomicrobium sp. GAS474 TaxID=1882831 RepID=UPI00087C6C5F|nr:4-alpha-glucanotransferase [Verrucomicrobium sp. GAS474]SDU10679.1 4-alpha-glucanotransferase [Verrucomicrobium sp. GAS474]
MFSSTTSKSAGLLIPVFALREEGGGEVGELGIGDAVSMRSAIDFCAAQKFRILQILPVNETGGDNSPYNAISSVALDPALLRLSPAEVPGLLPLHLQAVAPEATRWELAGPFVDYPHVKRIKLGLLSLAHAEFLANGTAAQKAEFDTFRHDNEAWLDPYTLFRTLLDLHHGDARWPLWNEGIRTPAAAKAWIGTLSAAEKANVARDRSFHAYVQWIAYAQWEKTKFHADKAGVELMGDIPFGVSRYSADVWADQELFDLDWSGGAPPERFFQTDQFTARWGQNWGIPLYAWDRHEARDFDWWRQRVALTCRVFHAFRIDHVLGFFRIYSFPWVPERNAEFTDLSEAEAAEKTGGRLPQFLPRPDAPEENALLNAEEGFHLLSVILEAAKQAKNARVIAEDLGVVPDYVRPLLHNLGIAGFTIPHFERVSDEDRSLKRQSTYPPINLVTYATHDHQPLATLYTDMVAHWTGPDGDEGWREISRLAEWLGMDPIEMPRTFTPQLHARFMEVLLQTPCWLAVFMITDLFGSRQRFNEPGSSGASNWSQRLDRSLSAYRDDPDSGARIAACTRLISATGRG